MDIKTRAATAIAVILVLLVIVILYKIKNDRKRKSVAIHFTDKNISGNAKAKKPGIWGIPSWGLALLTMFMAFAVLMVVGDFISSVFRLRESDAADLVFYILYDLIIAAGCFFIVRQNPKSIWYVPILSNMIGIISAIIEPNFWISALWILICSGWVLSIIGAILGAQAAKKKLNMDVPVPKI